MQYYLTSVSCVIFLFWLFAPIGVGTHLLYVDEEFFVALSFIIFVDLIGQRVVYALSNYLKEIFVKQKYLFGIAFGQLGLGFLKSKNDVGTLVLSSGFVNIKDFLHADLDSFLYQRILEFGYKEALESCNSYNLVERLYLNKVREKTFTNAVKTILEEGIEDSFFVLNRVSVAAKLSVVAKLN